MLISKCAKDRTEHETENIIDFLKSLQFFKKNNKLTYLHYRDYCTMLTYKEYEVGEDIYQMGDVPQGIYIVLSGSVTSVIRNEVID